MAFTVFYTVQISDVATKIFEAAGGKAVVTNHFFDEAGYIEELKALKPEAIMCRTEHYRSDDGRRRPQFKGHRQTGRRPR